MPSKFDPLAYIESAFIDADALASKNNESSAEESDLAMPELGDYIKGKKPTPPSRGRYRKTTMRAPRPRRAGSGIEALDDELRAAVASLPESLAFLLREYDDSVTSKSYSEFKESREELVKRLIDPQLTLEETSRLLGVCPATIRRYTNRGWLDHHRTAGGQRRFRLRDIVSFVKVHGRTPATD